MADSKKKTGDRKLDVSKYIETDPQLNSHLDEGNFDKFNQRLPEGVEPITREAFEQLRSDAGILDERAPLSVQQRKARGRTMRRYKSRIAMARKRAAKKKASPEKLKSRARKKARQILKDRLAAGKKYSEMTPAEKVQLDKRLLRVPDAVISRIAKRQLPDVRKGELARLARVRGASNSNNESVIDEAFSMFLESAKYYDDSMSQTTKDRRQSHFNKATELSDNEPDGYSPAPGDSMADTQPSTHTRRYHKMFKKEGSVNIDRRFKMYREKINPYSVDVAEQFVDDAFALMESVDQLYENKQAILNKSDETGISYDILKQVFDRGMAAWKSGHRPGTTPTQWGLARINSFATGGETQRTTDSDLWRQHRGIDESANSSDREEGTDSLVKIYRDATPGQQDEDYYDSDLGSTYGDFKRGVRVSFSDHSVDNVTNGLIQGTVVGGDVSHLKVRDDSGTVYNVRHDSAQMIESLSLFTVDEAFEFRFLDESSIIDRSVAAIHKHVIRGNDLQNVVWDFLRATGAGISAQDLVRHYVKQHGNPHATRPTSIQRAAELKRKYL